MSQKYQMVMAMILQVTAGLGSIPILTRFLSKEGFGSLALTLLIFNSYGALDVFRPVLVKRLTDNIEMSASILKAFFLITILFSILCVIPFAFTVSSVFPALSMNEILVLSTCFLIYFVVSVNWGILEFIGKVGTAVLVRSVFWLLVYVAFSIEAILKNNVFYSYWALVFFLIGTGIIFRSYARHHLQSQNEINLKGNIGKLVEPKHIFSTAKFHFLRAIIDYFDRIILARFLPISAYAEYALQYELGIRGNMIGQYVSQYAYPTLCRRKSKKDRERYANRVLILLGFPTLVACSCGVVFSAEILTLFAGKDFVDIGSNIFRFVMLAVFWSVFGFVTVPLLRASDEFSALPPYYGLSAVLGIVIVLLFVIKLGIIAAAIGAATLRLGNYLMTARALAIGMRMYFLISTILFLVGTALLLNIRILN